ncbi:MAG: HD domain-containing phosphohydrolase, partial [Spirochaetales bacterium]
MSIKNDSTEPRPSENSIEAYLEEVEEIEEIETGVHASPKETALSVKTHPCFQEWLYSFENPLVPWALLDPKLNLIWGNVALQHVYPDLKPGTNFIAYFYRHLGEEEVGRIYRSIVSKEKGFSFHGKIEYKTAERTKIIASITLSPLFLTDPNNKHLNPSLKGYTCHFDDITEEITQILRNTFKSLLEASKLKDNDTGNHIERVNAYSALIAEYLYNHKIFSEIDKDFINDIGFLAAMHDVGKIGTPDDILNKKGKLEAWEWEIMKEHTKNGAFLLSTYPNPMAKEIALCHHEKWDGTGYPYGLAKDMIPLSARIVALADVYDALRSKRSYKDPLTHQETFAILEKSIGSHFDPRVGKAALELIKEFERIYAELADAV